MTLGHSWGGAVNVTSGYTDYSNNYMYSDGIGMPAGNLASNGNRPIRIESVSHAYASGNGVYSTINYQDVETAGGSTFGSSGGSFQHRIRHTTGRMYFGRNSAAGGVVRDSADNVTVPGMLVGSLAYSTVPTPAQGVTVTDGVASGSVTVSWTPPASDGGSGVTSYTVQYSTDGFATVAGSAVSTGLNSNITGLTPGTLYSFRVGARNQPANDAGTTAAWSSVATLRPRSGGRVKRAGVYVPAQFFVKRAGAYVPAIVMVKRSGVYVPAQ